MTRLNPETTVVLSTREERLEKALSVALKFLSPDLPGDSRAVPDWFVACAAVQADLPDEDGKIEACLDEALALPDPEPSSLEPIQVEMDGVVSKEQAQRRAERTTRLTLHPPVHHPELEALLEAARNAPPMTEAEWAAQRASMARGLMGD